MESCASMSRVSVDKMLEMVFPRPKNAARCKHVKLRGKVLAVSVAAVSGEVHHLDRGRHLGVVLEEAEGEIVDLSSAPLLA